ncbi:hypothetical protein D3C72_1024870 [compost metagenome]
MVHAAGLAPGFGMSAVAHGGMIVALGGGAGGDQRRRCDGGEGGEGQTHGFPVLLGMGISAAFLCHNAPRMLETGTADHVPIPAI